MLFFSQLGLMACSRSGNMKEARGGGTTLDEPVRLLPQPSTVGAGHSVLFIPSLLWDVFVLGRMVEMLTNAKRREQAHRGFTLIEILVVIAIIGVLVALLLPAVQRARESARRSACKNKLKQLALALHAYHDSHRAFPSGVVTDGSGVCPTPMVGGAPWTVMLLPYMDQGSRYEDFNTTSGTYFGLYPGGGGSGNDQATNQLRANADFECPSDPNSDKRHGNMNYLGIMGGCANGSDAGCCTTSGFANRMGSKNGMFYNNSRTKMRDMVDGTTNVLMLGESRYVQVEEGSASLFATWASGFFLGTGPMYSTVVVISSPINSSALDPGNASTLDVMTRMTGSHHAGGAHHAMADGSVHFISEKMDMVIYRGLARRDDGEPVGGFEP
jgi:prepilin-type N-terminal cleavage/methylation domain-containing protein